jgi:hypothetical protein
VTPIRLRGTVDTVRVRELPCAEVTLLIQDALGRTQAVYLPMPLEQVRALPVYAAVMITVSLAEDVPTETTP